MSSSVASLLSSIADVGQDTMRGGYSRPVYSIAELDLRSWFIAEAEKRALEVEIDYNGIIWAWWDLPSGDRTGALVTGSHLDSVPGGGAFDGPLGIASALVAIDFLRDQGRQPEQALAIAVFPEEEGSRYGIACLGSRLFTGAIPKSRALSLTDESGTSFAEQSSAVGIDPSRMGPDFERLSSIGAFIELHVEQGRGLIDLEQPVAIGSSILGHGRWRLRFDGQGNHAGTTLMTGRRDPLIAASALISSIPSIALDHPGARATVGRVEPIPGGTNVIASQVDAWLDVRHPDDAVTSLVVSRITERAQEYALEQGCTVSVREESLSPTVGFDIDLRRRLEAELPQAPVLETGAGHDAGILAAYVPSAMLFVRNPTGISHSPEEHVEDSDAEAGATKLADVLMADIR
ncbi:allantoate amidohydrolase [Brevibacterium aurantiacum]|uniref:Allantoate amidohydrolase n=1 Tax=Brevibacterium aurantiacum TaxID=273384 RepID=A0A4Z0KDB4_BREAU|nr:allantoate amidohydrolase [Brevibacterium aurantiacum]TGD36509.1 allantoate amidohydrolase [Brevibacterium aurantiacum]